MRMFLYAGHFVLTVGVRNSAGCPRLFPSAVAVSLGFWPVVARKFGMFLEFSGHWWKEKRHGRRCQSVGSLRLFFPFFAGNNEIASRHAFSVRPCASHKAGTVFRLPSFSFCSHRTKLPKNLPPFAVRVEMKRRSLLSKSFDFWKENLISSFRILNSKLENS